MGIPHHHAQAAMAEEFGHRSKRGTLHDQPGSEGVPQIMPGEVFDLGDLHPFSWSGRAAM
jgi:hypothetical protein